MPISERYPRDMTQWEIKSLVGPAPLMLEIGCHEGSETIKFLRAMPGITLHCFEPDERPIRRFRSLFIREDPRVTLHECVIGNEVGLVDFYASTGEAGDRKDWDFSGSINQPTGHLQRSPEIGFKPPAKVPSTTLDSWYNSVLPGQIIDFIWADIQGAQRKFITGAMKTFPKVRYLYIECHHRPAYANEPTTQQLIEELRHWFSPVASYAENLLFENNKL